jgi:hypothetical protein
MIETISKWLVGMVGNLMALLLGRARRREEKSLALGKLSASTTTIARQALGCTTDPGNWMSITLLQAARNTWWAEVLAKKGFLSGEAWHYLFNLDDQLKELLVTMQRVKRGEVEGATALIEDIKKHLLKAEVRLQFDPQLLAK